MNFRHISEEYLKELRLLYNEAVRTGEMTAELSYRHPLDSYFKEISPLFGPSISRVFEPKNQAKAGRPDWRFYDGKTLGVYGYVEAKGVRPDKEISEDEHSQQIEKYLKLNHKVILTDGIEFIFYSPEHKSGKRLALIDKPAGSNWELSSQVSLLESEFRHFYEVKAARRVNEEQLIFEAAARATSLSESILELADLPVGAGLNDLENNTIEQLKELKTVVENHHDSSLNDAVAFSGFVSQVLIFGLIYAHRIVADPSDSPEERYKKIKSFWTNSLNSEYTNHLRPFSALVSRLENELNSLGPVGTWYEDCCLLLAYVELNQTQQSAPDYHILFERFLAAFDPDSRFDFGAFYTPQNLSRYSVKLVENIVSTKLSGIELYGSNSKLIDPCCGTGSFIEELIKSSASSNQNPEIIGFEIMPAPYALAQYRASILGEGYPENLRIVLTNTLSDELETNQSKKDPDNLIEAEQNIARDCAEPPLTLIIGNPPSSDSFKRTSGDKFSIIESLLEDFRPPASMRTGRQNVQKQLQNEFIKFLRWSGNKVMLSENGILALILPSSFAENPSYQYARKWLYDNFSDFWILDLDQDARTGVRASSIFNTLQGRLLLVAGRYEKDGDPQAYYASISGLQRREKNDFLNRSRSPQDYLSDFREFDVDKGTYRLRPIKPFEADKYDKFWPLYQGEDDHRYIFKRHSSGLKLAPSSLLVHPMEPLLIRRSRDIANRQKSVDSIKNTWYRGQDRPPSATKFTDGVRESLGRAASAGGQIIKYSYRPFLSVPALLNEEVLNELGKAPGGGTRDRPEVRSAYENSGVFGIAVAPSTVDIGESLHRFASFSWTLPDNDLCKRGNAHIFSNKFPEYKKARNWDKTPHDNINEFIVTELGVEPDDVVFYTYAVLCADAYLDDFEGALFTVANSTERPRIPVTKDPAVFKAISEFGKRLAELEHPDHNSEVSEDFEEVLNGLSAPFKLTGYSLDSENEEIRLSQDGEDMVIIKPIPREVINFQVSGYQVIQQWLKMHSARYSRTEFSYDQLKEFLNLLSKIDMQIQIVKELNTPVQRLLQNTDDLLIQSS